MLLTVGELQQWVDTDLPALVEELTDITGRGGESERRAWQRSLPRLTEALTSASLDELHVHFSRREHFLSLEYQLPGASAWCDVVVLGRFQERPSAIIIELKDWETSADLPGVAEGLIERHGSQDLHPSDQVRGYVEYCQRFHSAIIEKDALVHGFVLFTKGLSKHAYVRTPNDKLAANYPIFSMSREDIDVALPEFLRTRIAESDPEFATSFATGTYRQERGFLRQIGQTILNGDTRQFELLDNQRRALSLCLAKVNEAIEHTSPNKKVVVVEGPPGSGKSAVAAKLWASLVANENTPQGNICLVTTSQSQSSNWTYLIDRQTSTRIGRGVARKAAQYSPLSIPQLNQLRKSVGDKELYRNAQEWRKHLADLLMRGHSHQRGAERDAILVSLIDEAHALINPEREHGVGQYGFVTGLGPQAFHIIRCSHISVFFVDPEQSFRSRENTTIEDIEAWAREQGATFERISLHGVQFRCAGSAEYVAWVESLLGGNAAATNNVYASAWYHAQAHGKGRSMHQSANIIAFPAKRRQASEHDIFVAEGAAGYHVARSQPTRSLMDFRVFREPFSMEAELRKLGRNTTMRLVSTYSRRWKTKDSIYPHTLPAEANDFCETFELDGGKKRVWSRPWNFVPGGDYSRFIVGREGTPIHDDPLCEVGCTYAVRGFDFDYLGLLWLDDLLWRDGRWVVNLDNVHESGISLLVKQARKEGSIAPAGPRGSNVVEKLRQAYRILLTRAIKGIFVCIRDDETREHVERSLGNS